MSLAPSLVPKGALKPEDGRSAGSGTGCPGGQGQAGRGCGPGVARAPPWQGGQKLLQRAYRPCVQRETSLPSGEG